MGDKRYYIVESGHDHEDDKSFIIGRFFDNPELAIKFAEKHQLKKNCWICVSEWQDDVEFPTRLGTTYYRKET